jgi:hypothetical protein
VARIKARRRNPKPRDRRFTNLNLKVGDSAWFLFKVFSVILNVD